MSSLKIVVTKGDSLADAITSAASCLSKTFESRALAEATAEKFLKVAQKLRDTFKENGLCIPYASYGFVVIIDEETNSVTNNPWTF